MKREKQSGDPQGSDDYRVVSDSSASGRSPFRLLGDDGSELTMVNDFLDATALRGLSKHTLRTYANQFLTMMLRFL